MFAIDFQANVYLTDYRGADREDIEDRAAAAATDALRDHRIGFDAALAAQADRTDGEAPDAPSIAAYDAALSAAAAAVSRNLARAPGAFISLGWR